MSPSFEDGPELYFKYPEYPVFVVLIENLIFN